MKPKPKTKIIATLGDPSPDNPKNNTYKDGIFDENRNLLMMPTREDVIDLFVRNEVDLIRINMAHVKPSDFIEIKRAILKSELKYEKEIGFKKIGLLADLSGPKIRFKSEFYLPSELLTVSLNEIYETITPPLSQKELDKGIKPVIPKESVASLNLGGKSFAIGDESAAARIMDEVKRKLKEKNGVPLLAFIGDNDCTLEVINADENTRIMECKVISKKDANKPITHGKGFTIRGIKKPIQAFTENDKTNLNELLQADYKNGLSGEKLLTFIGISFCQNREDVRKVLFYIVDWLKSNFAKPFKKMSMEEMMPFLPRLIAKIETVEGYEKRNEILDLADGIMIARGDLALEAEIKDLPSYSKNITRHANLRGKPVIMATQMLESMKTDIDCARGEAVDVFSAVNDGADAIMLSGETSSGRYPALAILKAKELANAAEEFKYSRLETEKKVNELETESERLNYRDKKRDERISQQIQSFNNFHDDLKIRLDKVLGKDLWDEIYNFYSILDFHTNIFDPDTLKLIQDLCNLKKQRLKKQYSTDRISHATCLMAADEKVTAIVCPTTSGRTARMIARFRPTVWIWAQPHSEFVQRILSITRGVVVKGILPTITLRHNIEILMKDSKVQLDKLKDGNFKRTIIFTCGTPLGRVGSTNLLHRWELDEEDSKLGGHESH